MQKSRGPAVCFGHSSTFCRLECSCVENEKADAGQRPNTEPAIEHYPAKALSERIVSNGLRKSRNWRGAASSDPLGEAPQLSAIQALRQCILEVGQHAVRQDEAHHRNVDR